MQDVGLDASSEPGRSAQLARPLAHLARSAHWNGAAEVRTRLTPRWRSTADRLNAPLMPTPQPVADRGRSRPLTGVPGAWGSPRRHPPTAPEAPLPSAAGHAALELCGASAHSVARSAITEASGGARRAGRGTHAIARIKAHRLASQSNKRT